MSGLLLRAPSRLHFGLLAYDPAASRQFGGVGLMIAEPRLEVSAQPAGAWGADGPLAGRTLAFAERVTRHLAREGIEPAPAHFQIHRAPPEHVGLGVGTQLGLAVARLIAELAGRNETSASTLAEWSGRGLRSGIGLHGAARGGLIVDGGRSGISGIPPLLCQARFPTNWSVLLVIPRAHPGLHGDEEVQAFDRLPAIPDSVTDRLCRLVLLGLLPALVERNLADFGAALTEIQQHVGQAFAPAQGGTFAHPESEAIVNAMRAEGLQGVGQSSWGPTLYGFSEDLPDQRASILGRLKERMRTGTRIAWTEASERGVVVEGIG